MRCKFCQKHDVLLVLNKTIEAPVDEDGDWDDGEEVKVETLYGYCPCGVYYYAHNEKVTPHPVAMVLSTEVIELIDDPSYPAHVLDHREITSRSLAPIELIDPYEPAHPDYIHIVFHNSHNMDIHFDNLRLSWWIPRGEKHFYFELYKDAPRTGFWDKVFPDRKPIPTRIPYNAHIRTKTDGGIYVASRAFNTLLHDETRDIVELPLTLNSMENLSPREVRDDL